MTSRNHWRGIQLVFRQKGKKSLKMAQSSPKAAFISPIKPSGVIKLKVKKKKTTVPSSLRISNALKPINVNGLGQDGREQFQALKRKNPFKCSPRKKPNVTSENKTQDCRLFNALDGLDENLQNSSKGKREMAKKERDGNTEINKISFIENDIERAGDADTEKGGLKGSETFPLDWSLKYKIRFTSQKSFNWCGTLKTVEEAEGLSNFARCHVENENPIGLSGYPSSFCSATKVWMHPSLPWLDLFPRKSLDGKPGLKREVQISNEMASSLQKDWVSSFRSLFNLTRTGFCPYFYLVANQNSMLFQAAGLHGEQFVQVFITPTTKGFRDSLRNEGKNSENIVLTMKQNKPNRVTHSVPLFCPHHILTSFVIYYKTDARNLFVLYIIKNNIIINKSSR